MSKPRCSASIEVEGEHFSCLRPVGHADTRHRWDSGDGPGGTCLYWVDDAHQWAEDDPRRRPAKLVPESRRCPGSIVLGAIEAHCGRERRHRGGCVHYFPGPGPFYPSLWWG